jgi:hypothetical protein
MRVLNFSTSSLVYDNVIRIDRLSDWGNPFIIGIDGDRDEVCDKHKEWLEAWLKNKHEIIVKVGKGTITGALRGYSNKWVIEYIEKLKGKDLICWCSPLRCHGDYLLKLVEKLEGV